MSYPAPGPRRRSHPTWTALLLAGWLIWLSWRMPGASWDHVALLAAALYLMRSRP